MKIDFDVIEQIIDKYGSRKALVVIMGMWLIASMVIPETELWLKGVQIGGISILGVVGVWCQFKLDRDKETKPLIEREVQ
ncbi:MAG TPA: hypothetical protein ENH62_13055 [Marinobacter sp.]|uniref:Uncharacterized protein n=1 Tax=marine sediment metagenome TaxID=412755 RepID=A0A0F9SXJ7_9ZZZZ|nr:hypothetical protein [Marinobacter sp.]